MTLLQMATFICGKVNQRETEDILACKGFLTQRHDLTWQETLWKDSLVELRQTIGPDADVTLGNNLVPSGQTYGGGYVLTGLTPGAVYYWTPDDNGGSEVQTTDTFETLIATDAGYFIAPANGQVLLLGEGSDTVSATVQLATPAGYLPTKGVLLLPPIFQRVIAARTTSRKLNIQRPEFFYRIDYDAFSKTGEAADYILLPACVWELDESSSLSLVRGDVADAALSVVADLLDSDGVGVTRTTKILAAASNDLGESDRIDALTKATSTGTVRLQDENGFTLVTLAASDTNAKKRQRIRLIEIPSAETTIRILGKRMVPSFSADNDEPAISGIENCLIAFGLADMLERDESFVEAREKFQEAMMLLDQLKKVETVQQAHNQRITPEDGYGECSSGMRADSGNPLGQ